MRLTPVFIALSFFCSAFAQDRPEKIPIRLSGFLLDDDGNAISGGKLQIWQTDTLGIYDHPRSSNFNDGLDPEFQYFGTATSGEDGSYSFLTIRPEHYPARPESHIHFKIFVDDNLLLTTQLYFADENHSYPDSLQLDLTPHEDGGFSTEKDISVNLGGGGSNPVTPSQASGPYYPVVDFFDKGNVLILSDSAVENSETDSSANSEVIKSEINEEDVSVEEVAVSQVESDTTKSNAEEELVDEAAISGSANISSETNTEESLNEEMPDSEEEVVIADADVKGDEPQTTSSSASSDEDVEELEDEDSDSNSDSESEVLSSFVANQEISSSFRKNGLAAFLLVNFFNIVAFIS